jgi:hypothetical protein
MYTNYSIKDLTESYKNREFLIGINSVDERRIFFNFEINPNFKQLEAQARTFANNYDTHGYIKLHKVLRVNPYNVTQDLYEMYIYSYVKALYNGLYNQTINNKNTLGYVLMGHFALYSLLCSPQNSGIYKSFQISIKIKTFSDVHQKALITRFLTKYNFLSEGKETFIFGKESFAIKKYEAFLNRLADDHYARGHVIKSENSSNKANTNDNLTYDQGQLHLMNIMPDNMSEVFHFNNVPIMNSFMNYNQDKFYYINVKNGINCQYNPSFVFSKANFITLSSEQNETEIADTFYKSYSYNERFNRNLTGSEVHCITGITCKTIHTNDTEYVKPIDFDRIKDFINKFKDSEFWDLIDIIITESIDVDELMEPISAENDIPKLKS